MGTWDFARPMLIFAAVVLVAIGCLFGSCTCAMVNGAEPRTDAAIDRVDLIEVNHLYDTQGRHVIDQLIFWDWDKDRFSVRAWRLVKDDNCLPLRDRNGDYVCYWRDMQTLRKVSAPRKRETWTMYDPEVLDREYKPIESRLDLVKVK